MEEALHLDAGATAQAPAGLAERPGVFTLKCSKCLREYDLHGRESILEAILLDEGWVRDGDTMVCPHGCLVARDTPAYNKSQEQERRARRAA